MKSRRSPGLAPSLARTLFGMDQAGDRISELGFVIANAVAADDGASGFHHLRKAAGQNALENFEIAFFGEADQRERSQRTSAHGVDVAQRVGGGDLSEGVGIVDDGREEVDGLHQRGVGRDLIHSGVVGVIEADQHIRVMLPG